MGKYLGAAGATTLPRPASATTSTTPTAGRKAVAAKATAGSSSTTIDWADPAVDPGLRAAGAASGGAAITGKGKGKEKKGVAGGGGFGDFSGW